MCEHAGCTFSGAGVRQTLDEMEFERGLWSAAQQDELARLQRLLAAGTSADAQDAAGYTPLHYAARAGHTRIVAELLQAGADVNAKTRAGQATALHRAASAGQLRVVQLLLARNADVNAVDADGKTVLHRAAEAQHHQICQLLCKAAPAALTVADCRGQRPIDYVTTHQLRDLFSKYQF